MIPYTSRNLNQFLIEVAKGNVEGHSPYLRQGHNDAVAIGAAQNIWSNGGRYVFTTVGEIVAFVSDSGLDTAAGTGWRKARVTGIDENYIEQTEIITFAGIVPVNTQFRYIFISDVCACSEGTEVGSLEVNQGTITATGNTSAKTFLTVDPLIGRNQQIFDIVPAGKTLVIVKFHLTSRKTSGGQQPDVKLTTFLQPLGLGKTLAREDTLETAAAPVLELPFPVPYVLPSTWRYWIDVITDTADTEVDGVVSGFYVENKYF